ncbi:MAG: hypothetical protein EBR82_02685 [Caulobacteraceae bacterium]|nr:hypothetical protein [Caulobacteraceae bacterium]
MGVWLSLSALIVGVLLAVWSQRLANKAASSHPEGLKGFRGRLDPPFVKFGRALDAYQDATGDRVRKWQVYGLGAAGLVLTMAGGIALISRLPDVR